ncbi:MAG: hypothetical protein LCH59_00565 [Proteobacteria bacterium]|nr:hypothetical protein [Pseudomonadota bacterium]
MAAGFQYFTSDDVGAPGVWGVAGRWAQLLDWLLPGMGGWAIEFTGTNLRAYRSGTGNRFYLRLDDTQARYARLRAYRAMTAIGTGTNQFPTNAQASNINTWGIAKTYQTPSTVPRRYWGIRTNRYVVVILEYGAYSDPSVEINYRELFVFGDTPSLCEADAHSTALVCFPGVDSQYPALFNQVFDSIHGARSLGGPPVYGAVSGSPDGSILSPGFGACVPFTYNMSAAQEATIGKSGRLHFGSLIGMSNNAQTGDSAAYPRCRFPNLHQVFGPVRSVANANSAIIDLEEFTIGGRTFKCFAQYSQDAPADGYSTDAVLLEITDTDGAL